MQTNKMKQRSFYPNAFGSTPITPTMLYYFFINYNNFKYENKFFPKENPKDTGVCNLTYC